MDEIKDIFQTKFVIYFFVNYISQVILLFEIVTVGLDRWRVSHLYLISFSYCQNQWISAYPPLLVAFIEMMFYFVMGSQLTIADERLCSFIYTSNWYKYDVKSQKIVQLLLHRSQQDNELQLGPMGPLTVVTGVEVYAARFSLLEHYWDDALESKYFSDMQFKRSCFRTFMHTRYKQFFNTSTNNRSKNRRF